MRLAELTTLNFRNLTDHTRAFSAGIQSIYGLNGQGKTNVLEAMYLALTGISYSNTLRELVRHQEHEAYIKAVLDRAEGQSICEVGLGRGKRVLKLDGVRVRNTEALRGSAVLISPEDSQMILGSPAERRRFLDHLLSKISGRYSAALELYHKNLLQRNAALKSGELWALEVFDQKLAEYGSVVLDLRQRVLEKLQQFVNQAHSDLGGTKTLSLSLKTSTTPQSYSQDFLLRRSEELARGSTSIGPHRDDLSIGLDGHDSTQFASRGEARTIALALRYAEYQLLQERYQETPILLIDDFSAELDPERRAALLQLAQHSPQAIITGTEPLPHAHAHHHMQQGQLG